MKFLGCLCSAFIAFYCHSALSAEQITLVRNIVVESCSENLSECQQISNDKPADVNISLFDAGKTKGGRPHGESKFQILLGETPFKGEIYINKMKNGYSIYTVPRSGHGTKRQAVTNKIKTESLSKFDPIEMTDKPILVDGKNYRAKMSVSPAPL